MSISRKEAISSRATVSPPSQTGGPHLTLPTTTKATGPIDQIRRQLDAGQPDEALRLATARAGGSPDLQNARAVCLMRVGQPDAAVQVLRGLTLLNGGSWFRENIPEVYKRNLATALLLSGNVQGARRIVAELSTPPHARTEELRQVLTQWARGLSFTRWIQWKGGVEMQEIVPVPFAPGELTEV